ncbi:hypothetical protein [Ectopseudomonas guguanensis]|uniref:Uncharacterized protein n=1 Tax=Ectopseudomonas guguanensis TaxID=1198456 RepID=A0A1H0S393_9GAMM|nr:hypothetical protein [Pseudomonas guguanensis]SDP35726.1 hypothetical protein SAMN05216213_103399 [Pseudomonas guguanensis]
MRQCLGRTRGQGRCKRMGSWWLFCAEHRSLKLAARSVAALSVVSGVATLLGWYSITPDNVWSVFYAPQRSMMEVIESASIEGVKYTRPSSENVVAKVMSRAGLDDSSPLTESNFLFTLVSPFKPFTMDTIFRGDGCRLLGKGKGLSDDARYGYIDIVGVSCVDDRGIGYELHASASRRLGFVTNVGDLASRGVRVVKDREGHTLRQSDNVMIRFDLPVAALSEVGRTR